MSDPNVLYGTGGNWYCGLMLHGNRNNSIESFSGTGPTAQLPPNPFFLLSPFDGDTVEVANPLLDWMDALELNPGDVVYYRLFASLSPVYDPDSTYVIDSLTVSELTMPASHLLDLYRKGESASVFALQETAGVRNTLLRGSAPSAPAAPLPDDVEIFWKVSAYDNTGQDTTWSINTDWSFFTSIPDAPNPFTLITPADEDTVESQNLDVTFIWHSATDPDPADSLLTYSLTYRRVGDDPVFVQDLADTVFASPPLVDNSTYTWFVTATDGKGLTRDTETWTFTMRLPSGIEEPGTGGGNLPRVFALSQNYPNPFNPRTTISFDVPEKEQEGVHVNLAVFSVRGLKVKTLLAGQLMMPGTHQVAWDGRDEQGVAVGSGIYLYRITAGEWTSERKMIVLK
jgi:hypothetical protein